MIGAEAGVCGLIQRSPRAVPLSPSHSGNSTPAVFHKRVKDRLLPSDLDVICEAREPLRPPGHPRFSGG